MGEGHIPGRIFFLSLKKVYTFKPMAARVSTGGNGMNEHSIFYYPYASFKGEQELLLKAAALYFDKLYILNPVRACWDGIGQGPLNDDLILLEQEHILERIVPETIMHKYERIISASIRADMNDPEFLKLCKESGRAGKWTLALAKVPGDIRDEPMQRIMGDVARDLSHDFTAYNEQRDTNDGTIEYRCADFSLPMGESIMINHALFAGLLETGATPLTDDPFHSKVLALKIRRALQVPEISSILEDRAKKRELKASLLAMTALTDLELAILSPKIPMADILKYRHENEGELTETRRQLGMLARKIREEPWTEGFASTLDSTTIPDIQESLIKAKKTQKTWFRSTWGRRVLNAARVAVGAASVGISLSMAATPLLPLAVATGACALVKDAVIPGTELALGWNEGREAAMGNGLHYLVNVPGKNPGRTQITKSSSA